MKRMERSSAAGTDCGTRRGTTSQRRRTSHRRRPRTRTVIVAGGLVVLVVIGVVLAQPSSPVGHWRSAEGADDFRAAYDAAMAEMPEPDESVDIRTDFGIVRVYRFAAEESVEPADSRPPFLLLPGNGASTPMWTDTIDRYRSIADVYTVDQLGHPGMSVQERPITTDAEQAEWLGQALEALDEERFTVVGLSIGGRNAVNLAVHRPEVVSGLVLLDPALVFAPVSMEFLARSLPTAIPWLPESWRDSFNSWTAGGQRAKDSAVGRMLDAGQRGYAMSLPQPQRIEEDALRGLEIPVLAILGRESVIHDAEAAESTARSALIDGTVEVYEGGSHAVGLQEAERVAEDVRRFVDSHDW